MQRLFYFKISPINTKSPDYLGGSMFGGMTLI